MEYLKGKKIKHLSTLTIRDLKNNIALDIDDYIEKKKLFNDGVYKLLLPFKNGEAVWGSLIINDIYVSVEFDRDAEIFSLKKEHYKYFI